MLHPPNISAFSDENNRQLVMNFVSVLFNTQVKAIKHDGHLCTFKNVTLASLLQNNESLKGIPGEANMITVSLIQAADVLYISSDNMKEWVSNVKEQQNNEKASRLV